MSKRLKEIEKYWPIVFPIGRTRSELSDFVTKANLDIGKLLSEVHRLREAIVEISKNTNDSIAYGIAKKALEEE